MNSIKNKLNSSKNKLNSKINLPFKLKPNTHLFNNFKIIQILTLLSKTNLKKKKKNTQVLYLHNINIQNIKQNYK